MQFIESYLNGRLQCTRGSNVTTSNLLVTHGVSQGSTLGTTLFLVYNNHLTNIKVVLGEIISFADDTDIMMISEFDNIMIFSFANDDVMMIIFSVDTWSEVFDAV